MAAVPFSRLRGLFLRGFQNISCNAVAELVEIVIKIAYIGRFFRRNGKLLQDLQDALGQQSSLGQGDKIPTGLTRAIPFCGALILTGGRLCIHFDAGLAKRYFFHYTLLLLSAKSGYSDSAEYPLAL